MERWVVNKLVQQSGHEYRDRIVQQIKRVDWQASRREILEQLRHIRDQLPFQFHHAPYVDVSHLRDIPLPECPMILDVGTEYREYLYKLEAMYGGQAWGVNTTEGGCTYLHSAPLDHPRFFRYDGIHLPEAIWRRRFDMIHLRMVLHHIPHFRPLLAKLVRLLKPRGQLVILEHDFDKRHPKARQHIPTLDLVHDVYDYVLADQPIQTLSQIRLVDKRTLIRMLEQWGLEVQTWVQDGRSFHKTFMSRRVFIATRRA